MREVIAPKHQNVTRAVLVHLSHKILEPSDCVTRAAVERASDETRWTVVVVEHVGKDLFGRGKRLPDELKVALKLSITLLFRVHACKKGSF